MFEEFLLLLSVVQNESTFFSSTSYFSDVELSARMARTSISMLERLRALIKRVGLFVTFLYSKYSVSYMWICEFFCRDFDIQVGYLRNYVSNEDVSNCKFCVKYSKKAICRFLSSFYNKGLVNKVFGRHNIFALYVNYSNMFL